MTHPKEDKIYLKPLEQGFGFGEIPAHVHHMAM